MATKKSRSDDYLNIAILAKLADQISALENKNMKKWSTGPKIKRGEDLHTLIAAEFPGIGDDAYRVAMWVDLYAYMDGLLLSEDTFVACMDIDQAMSELMKYEKKHPEDFQNISYWVWEFGCLLVEGSESYIGSWFHDSFVEICISLGIIETEY